MQMIEGMGRRHEMEGQMTSFEPGLEEIVALRIGIEATFTVKARSMLIC